MEESESSSSASTSPNKRPADPDVQEAAPRKKANSTSIHQEFTRFKFTKGGEERTGSRCNECSYEMMDTNPTNLKAHYKRKHPSTYEKVIARDKEHKESLKQSIQELGKPIAESLFLSPKDLKKGKTQAVWTPEQQKHGNQLLAVAVAGSCLPMSFVRDKNVKRWVSYIAPQYKLPCDKKITKETAEVAEVLRAKIRDELRRGRRINLTTDIWSQKLGVHSYFGLTAHFVNTKEGRRESLRIACRQFDESHSGLNIAAKLMELLKELSIEDKAFHCISDSASNMIKGLTDFNNLQAKEIEDRQKDEDEVDEEDQEEIYNDSYCQDFIDNDPYFEREIALINEGIAEMEEKIRELNDQSGVHCSCTTRLPCVAHKVHLVVEKCVSTKMQCFGPLLKRVRSYVVKYRMSSKAKTYLIKLFEKRLPGFIPSRWWTDIIMLEVFLEAANHPKQPLYHLTIEMKWGITFSIQEIRELEKLMSIMSPMEKMFCKLNSEKISTIHLVFPTVKAALATLEPLVNDEADSAHSFAKEMKAQIESYFSFVLCPDDPCFLPIYWAASFLCPFYRFVITSEELPVVKAYLENAVSPLVAEAAPAPTSDNNNIMFVLPGGLSSLSDGLSQTLTSNVSEGSVRDKLDQDIQTYIRAADLHLKGLKAEACAKAAATGNNKVELVAKDPLDFWFAQESSKNYQTDLPEYAQDMHACPPTSVASERMFSLSGCLSGNRFANIKPASLENRVLVKANKFI